MSVLTPSSESNREYPVTINVSYSQHGLSYVNPDFEEGGEGEKFIELQSLRGLVLETANKLRSKDPQDARGNFRSSLFKTTYGKSGPIKVYEETEPGNWKISRDFAGYQEGVKEFKKQMGLRTEAILFMYNRQLGVFSLKLHGLAYTELIDHLGRIKDQDFDKFPVLEVAGTYEKENPRKAGETLKIPVFKSYEAEPAHVNEAVKAAKESGLLDYLNETLKGGEAAPAPAPPAPPASTGSSEDSADGVFEEE